MENPRPQLNLVDLRQLRWFLGGLIGVLSAWSVFYMEVDALITLGVITVAVPVFTLFPRFSNALPAVFHRLAFPVIVALFAFDLWSTREPLPAMVRLDLMLLCYRCIAPRGRREDLQLILLALFLVVVTGVSTVSIAFVAQILLFTATSLALLLAVTLSDSRAGGAVPAVAGAAEAGWERVRWLELFARLRAVTDLRLLAFASGLFGSVVVLSALLFLALPRFEITSDFFLDNLITKKSMTGFSENVTFQDVVDIQQDESVSMMVDVSDPAAVPSEPYWRMLVLDEYSGNGFRMSAGLRATLVPTREKTTTHSGRGEAGPDDAPVWTVYFQPGVSRYLPLMGAFRTLTFGEPHTLVLGRRLRLAALPVEPAKMIAYRIEGMITDGIMKDPDFAEHGRLRLPAWRMVDPEMGERRRGEGGPEGDPLEATFLELELPRSEDTALLRKWVDELGGRGEGGAEFARRAGAWLQSRHSYSLSMRLEEGEGDPLVRWMGSDQPGHCELFAGGLVLLARAAGVPARIVTGFKGGTWNPTSGSITVRNSDAHAWVEIWDEALGAWLRSDATPGADITPAPSVPNVTGAPRLELDEGWRARIDGLRILWYRRVVSFDQGSQLQILRGTKEQISGLVQGLRSEVEGVLRDFVDWVRTPWDISRVAAILLTVGSIVGAVVLWRRAGRAWWMAWRSHRSASHRRDPVRIEASRWLVRLERTERTRPAVEPALRAAVGEARARLLRLRYGPRETWARPATVFRQARNAARALARGR